MLVSMLLTLAASASPRPAAVETTLLDIPGARGERLALHCVSPEKGADKAILFIHGASFPTRVASGFEFAPGDSWLHAAARHGYLACGLDFLGFGDSSRPRAMQGDRHDAPPVMRGEQAAEQIALAVNYLHAERNISTLHVVAHSWGTVPAARFAAMHPGELVSLTLFGPIVPIASASKEQDDYGAWWSITAPERLEQLHYKSVLPPDLHLLEPAVEQSWAAAFSKSAPHAPTDAAGVLRIPSGPSADIHDARLGIYPYRAADVRVPVFVVYGSYDNIVNDQTAAPFLSRFVHSPLRWQLHIDDGTHVMHLEKARRSLYESVNAFVQAAESMGH